MTTPADTQRQRAHAAKLLRDVAADLHGGKPAMRYLPKLREACDVVTRVTAAEVAMAHEADTIAKALTN